VRLRFAAALGSEQTEFQHRIADALIEQWLNGGYTACFRPRTLKTRRGQSTTLNVMKMFEI